MITNELQGPVAEVQRAQEALEKAILARMDEIARQLGLSEIVVGIYGTSYLCNDGDEEMESEALDEVEQLYLDHIHSGGFLGLWTPEKGWVV
jgi:hypothetical protein